MKIARLQDGIVVEILPHRNFHADVLKDVVDAPDEVDLGWAHSAAGDWITPSPSENHSFDGSAWIIKPERQTMLDARAKRDAAKVKLAGLAQKPVMSIQELTDAVRSLMDVIG